MAQLVDLEEPAEPRRFPAAPTGEDPAWSMFEGPPLTVSLRVNPQGGNEDQVPQVPRSHTAGDVREMRRREEARARDERARRREIAREHRLQGRVPREVVRPNQGEEGNNPEEEWQPLGNPHDRSSQEDDSPLIPGLRFPGEQQAPPHSVPPRARSTGNTSLHEIVDEEVRDYEARSNRYWDELINNVVFVRFQAKDGQDIADSFNWTDLLYMFQEHVSYIRTIFQPIAGAVFLDVLDITGHYDPTAAIIGHGGKNTAIGAREMEVTFSRNPESNIRQMACQNLHTFLLHGHSADPSIGPLCFYHCPYFTGTSVPGLPFAQASTPRERSGPGNPSQTQQPRGAGSLLRGMDGSELRDMWRQLRDELVRRGDIIPAQDPRVSEPMRERRRDQDPSRHYTLIDLGEEQRVKTPDFGPVNVPTEGLGGGFARARESNPLASPRPGDGQDLRSPLRPDTVPTAEAQGVAPPKADPSSAAGPDPFDTKWAKANPSTNPFYRYLATPGVNPSTGNPGGPDTQSHPKDPLGLGFGHFTTIHHPRDGGTPPQLVTNGKPLLGGASSAVPPPRNEGNLTMQDFAEMLHHLGQKSVLDTTGGIVKAMKEEGVLKSDPPRFDNFSGDDDVKGVSFDMYRFQVESAGRTHTAVAIRDAMMKSLKGTAAEVVKNLDLGASWQELLKALQAKFQVVGTFATLSSKLFSMKKEEGQSVSAYSVALESVIADIRKKFPENYPQGVADQTLREKFFEGLPDNIKNQTRHNYDNPQCTYRHLLESARIIEAELGLAPSDKKSKEKDHSKQKQKVNVAAVAATPLSSDPQLAKLEQLFQGSQGQMQQFDKKLEALTQVVSQVLTHGSNRQNSNSNSNYNSNSNWRGRGRGRGRGRSNGNNGNRNHSGQQSQQGGSTGNGGHWPYEKQCYFCRDSYPQGADHLIKNCSRAPAAKKAYWEAQLQVLNSQPQQEVGSSPGSSTTQENSQGGLQ